LLPRLTEARQNHTPGTANKKSMRKLLRALNIYN
jgi:hypothetical protein